MPFSLDTTVPSIAASGRSRGGSLGALVGLVGTERLVAGTIGIACRRTAGANGVSGGMGGKLGTELDDFMVQVGVSTSGAASPPSPSESRLASG